MRELRVQYTIECYGYVIRHRRMRMHIYALITGYNGYYCPGLNVHCSDHWEVFLGSVCNVPCMLCPYVCTYGAILRIRLAEEYQLVGNKQAGEQQRIMSSSIFILSIWTK